MGQPQKVKGEASVESPYWALLDCLGTAEVNADAPPIVPRNEWGKFGNKREEY